MKIAVCVHGSADLSSWFVEIWLGGVRYRSDAPDRERALVMALNACKAFGLDPDIIEVVEQT